MACSDFPGVRKWELNIVGLVETESIFLFASLAPANGDSGRGATQRDGGNGALAWRAWRASASLEKARPGSLR